MNVKRNRWRLARYALNHFQPQGGTFGTARGTFGFDGSLTALEGGTGINSDGTPYNSWPQFNTPSFADGSVKSYGNYSVITGTGPRRASY